MRTFTEVVNQLAAEQSDGLWVRAGASNKGVLAWNPITWSQLARAVDYVLHWMETRHGPTAENETVAYMGISYVRYPIIIFAMKTGCKIHLTSPHNPQDAQVHFLDLTRCTEFVDTPQFAAQMQALAMSHAELNPVEILWLDDILHHEPSSALYDSFRRPRENGIALILHPRGSTGLPKPILIYTGALAAMNTTTSMSAPSGRLNMHDELFAPKPTVSMLPLFHIMRITVLVHSICHQGPLAILLPRQLASTDLLISAFMQNKPRAAAFTPSVIEEICNMPNDLETLSTLDYVSYSDAPLARSCGDQTAQLTNLQVCIGRTEFLNAPNYLTQEPRDQEYIEWSADTGSVIDPATERSFRMVIQDEHMVRKSDGVDAPTGLAGIEGMVRAALRACLGSSDREYTDDDDDEIFVGAFDSLRVLALSNILLSLFL
ncbi:acetyl-CoA synthetase-like protein [Aspergillus campestris IBT 28561]|uniref:Acetyl-CoA synthetase-like protein n=1 Tax=Aspergillus campestris (strain IBT 28561) TaxID=1392248 RepID=A0A2I1DB41_ASPC2|nr:acetyl-CoA synthetase-like protein [Aspergillus campestris IBT 28561]PKY07089.1 acetyl-CoA synthetase-like protein [Aspergillus campestris IBT 28561]